MSQPRIFVSHSHKDEDFTQRLVSDLHQAGAEVWVDVAGITHGNFMQHIDEALVNCDWLVLVLTPNAITSQYVKTEVYAALMRVKQGYMRDVIPVLAVPCAPGTIPAQWDLLHRYDATADYAAALAGVLRAVGLPPLAPTPGPVVAAPAPPLTSTLPPDRFPERLSQLGYEGRIINGVEVIIPPVCEVPAGEFLMGIGSAQHTVTLPAFQIGHSPVTVAEYACFIRAVQQPVNQGMDWQAQLKKPDHPVVAVVWHDAWDYASWLAYVTGLPWRLPTEAEWEKAASWDPVVNQPRIYPWGNAFEQWRCNTKVGEYSGNTTPVGAYPAGASPCGALDMAGNVAEWTSSLLKPFPYNASDGREGEKELLDARVVRGGSFNEGQNNARANYRSGVFEGLGYVWLGFRLACAVSNT